MDEHEQGEKRGTTLHHCALDRKSYPGGLLNQTIKSHNTGNDAILWQPPRNAWVKINVDGGFDPASTTGST
jgi:hypothetical protein